MPSKKLIYLDYAATTPTDKKVLSFGKKGISGFLINGKILMEFFKN